MITHQEVKRQLRKIGADFAWWGRGEANELPHILIPGENIQFALNGRYEGGFAMMVVTDQRILLIDKKPFYLTLEDVRYDMVSEVDFNQRLMNSTIVICTVNKTLRFTTIFGIGKIREATSYVQGRVMEFRHQPSADTSVPTHNFNQQISVPAPQAAFRPKPGFQPSSQFQQQEQNRPYEFDNDQSQGLQNDKEQRVKPIVHRITNPYTRVPLMMRRRVSRFYS